MNPPPPEYTSVQASVGAFRNSTVHTDLVATYRVDDEGKVAALRAYWSIDELRFG